MKKIMLMIAVAMCLNVVAMAQTTAEKLGEWKIVTVVESIVPMGLGRSRMIVNTTEVSYQSYRRTKIRSKKYQQKRIKSRKF